MLYIKKRTAESGMDVTNITKPHNPYITLARYLLAIYVLFFHLLPRAAYYGYDVQPFLHLQLILIQLFHSANETNPAVIAFLVIFTTHVARIGKVAFGVLDTRAFLQSDFSSGY